MILIMMKNDVDRSGRLGIAAKARERWGAPIEASLAVLELAASEQPELLEFQAHVLGNSTMSFAVQKLAAAFDVPPEKVGRTVTLACKGLDRLEKHRGKQQDPEKLLDAPNLAALLHVCHARLNRVTQVNRCRRLERIQRTVKRAYEQARTRAWIDDFIGPLPATAREGQSDVR